MTAAAITIVGLGPGRFEDLTLEARTLLARAAQEKQTVYFRTLIHAGIEELRQEFPELGIESFDRLYEESEDWATLYERIAAELCERAAQEAVIYAVPGHPAIGELSVQRVVQQARARGLSTKLVAGLSFIEPICTLLELDPFEGGTQLVDATSLASLQTDEIAGKIIPTVPLLVGQVYNRRLASAVKLALGECYPDDWPVKLVRTVGVDSEESVVEMPLYEFDRHSFVNHLSTLYVPPVPELSAQRLPETLRYIIMRLRRDPDGCPWDREQTHQSLTRYVLEETYEVVEALEENDTDHLAEELGDLLLQVYLHAEIARQNEEFTLGDVLEHLNAKLIRRHPHVFGEVQVSGSDHVVQNWEAIKKQERANAGTDVAQESVLDRVPQAAPALVVSQEYQKRVIKTGFEFSTFEGLYEKLQEELQELHQATTPEEQREEFGDLFFMLAKWANWLKIDAEESLRLANRKFRARFQAMEMFAREEGRELTSYSGKEWRALWQRAKVHTKKSVEMVVVNEPDEDEK